MQLRCRNCNALIEAKRLSAPEGEARNEGNREHACSAVKRHQPVTADIGTQAGLPIPAGVTSTDIIRSQRHEPISN